MNGIFPGSQKRTVYPPEQIAEPQRTFFLIGK
jgi:hypothetical protein